jgi:hypothetical protein
MGLIKKIIATTKMENCNPNWVPAAKEALGIDPEGEPMKEDWSYPSVIGMILYLNRNHTILSRYSVGIQRQYTCRCRW